MPKSELSEKEFFSLIENIIRPENNSEAISFLRSLHCYGELDTRFEWVLQNQPFIYVAAKLKDYDIKIYKIVIEDNYVKEFVIQLSRKYTLVKSIFNSTKKIVNPMLSLLKENSEIVDFKWYYDNSDRIPSYYFSSKKRDRYSEEVDFVYWLHNEKNSQGQGDNYAYGTRDFIIFRYNCYKYLNSN